MDQAVLEPPEKRSQTPPSGTPSGPSPAAPSNEPDSAPRPATPLQERITNTDLTPEGTDLSQPPTFIVPALKLHAEMEHQADQREAQAMIEKAFEENVAVDALASVAGQSLVDIGTSDIAESLLGQNTGSILASNTLASTVESAAKETATNAAEEDPAEELPKEAVDGNQSDKELDPSRRYAQAPGSQYTEENDYFGNKAANPANAYGRASNKTPAKTKKGVEENGVATEKKDRFERTKAARDKYKETRGEYGNVSRQKPDKGQVATAVEKAEKKRNDQLKKQLRKQLIREAATVVTAFLAETFWIWGPILLVILIILVVVMLIVGLSRGKLLNKPPGTISTVPAGFTTTTLNPEGLHVAGTVTSLSIAGARTTRRLEMETTTGLYVDNAREYYLNDAGRVCYKSSPSECTPFMGHYNPKTKKVEPFHDDEATWSIDMRWPYVHSISWTDMGTLRLRSGGLELQAMYGGRKVILYNLDTGKAVVAAISEYGPPRPAAGVCHHSGSDWSGTIPKSKNKYNNGPDNTCEAEEKAWNDPKRMGETGDFRQPSNYTGYSIEGTTTVTKALGATNYNRISIGFVPIDKEDSYSLGTLEGYKLEKANKTVTGAGATVSLKVPGVNQMQGDTCGAASASMVALYYNLNKGSRAWNGPDDYPSSIKGFVTPVKGATNDSNAFYDTLDTKTCINIPNAVKGVAGAGNWSFVHLKDIEGDGAEKRKRLFNAITSSLRAGDPVITYTKPGTMYDNQHIMVITGYDGKNGFTWNNPSPHGVEKNITGKPGMQWPALFDNLGGQGDDPTKILAINLDHIQKSNNAPISTLPDDPQ